MLNIDYPRCEEKDLSSCSLGHTNGKYLLVLNSLFQRRTNVTSLMVHVIANVCNRTFLTFVNDFRMFLMFLFPTMALTSCTSFAKIIQYIMSWSPCRNYKSTFIWIDVIDDDVILPLLGSGEYVIRASELIDIFASKFCSTVG